jgi:hypothetical protein
VIPAALLQPPFFDPRSDAAVQFGSLGFKLLLFLVFKNNLKKIIRSYLNNIIYFFLNNIKFKLKTKI